MSNILAIARDAADSLRLQRPEKLFNSYYEGDTSDRLLLRSMTQTCRYLSGMDWSALKSRHSFTALAQEAQTDKMPTDFLRIVDGTVWNKTLNRVVCGPMTDDDYAKAKSPIVSRVEPEYKLFGNDIHLVRDPVAGHIYELLYIRDAVGKDSVGAYLQRFAADTDTALWDDELMILGAIYQYRKNERFDYAQDEIDFKIRMHDILKRDGGASAINMGQCETANEMLHRMKSAALIVS